MNNIVIEDADFHYRDAIRLLYILIGVAVPAEKLGENYGATHIFIGEKRLMALDFYIRYPDYLANRLLDEYEAVLESKLLILAEDILKDDEPDVRTVLMIRWKRGAYQRVETALSILEAPSLIKTVKNVKEKGKPWTYLLYPRAFEVAQDAIIQQPSLSWYEKQVSALTHIPFQQSGTLLKQEQYNVPEYDKADFGSVIPSIRPQVIERLQELKNG